jgi:hypothetical protein
MNVTVGLGGPGKGVTVEVGKTTGVSNLVACEAGMSVTCGVGVTYTAMGVGLTQATNRNRAINSSTADLEVFLIGMSAHTTTVMFDMP